MPILLKIPNGSSLDKINTNDATALSSDILLNKTAYVNGVKVIGNIVSKSSQTYIPTTTDQTIESGLYLSGVQTIKGEPNLIPANIVDGVSIFGVEGTSVASGLDTSDATALASNILLDKTAYVNGVKVTGTIENLPIQYQVILPSTETVLINPGYYIDGGLGVVGEPNLIPANIVDGVSIFGVEGTSVASGLDTSDATATASDILLNKTAYVNGVKVTGSITSKVTETFTPTVIDQTISTNQYLFGDQIIKGDENLVAGNIKDGITIFGVAGNYVGDGEGGIVQGSLIDTLEFTSKQQTLDTYGSLIYINESSDVTKSFITLTSMVAKWGGLTAQNNYIGGSGELYGVNMSNWSEQKVTNKILFLTPLTFKSGNVILKFNCNISSWMNITLNVHFITATGNTTEEIVDSIETKVNNTDYAFSKTFTYAGSISKTEFLVLISNVVAGTYYIVIDGTTKADNASFTYITLNYLNF